MKLPFKRSKSKKAQAADVVGSAAKLWADLQIAKRASKGVKTGSKKASSAKDAVGSKARTTPAKAAGALALLGGAGVLLARKLKGGGAEPLPYEPPPRAAESSDTPAATPLAAVAGPDEPAIAVAGADEPAIVVKDTPIVLEDLAGPSETGADESPAGESADDDPGPDKSGDDEKSEKS